MDDLADPLSERIAPAAKTQTRAREVAAHRDHALGVGMIGAEQTRQCPLDPRSRLAIVRTPHERVDGTVAALQVADQKLHADEAGRAGKEHAIPGTRLSLAVGPRGAGD